MRLPTPLDPAVVASYLTSGGRMARRRFLGMRRFPGDAGAICRAVIEACWTGRYFTASGGHFRQAWTRDLGFAAPSLVRLGHGQRVRASLARSLGIWSAGGHVTTTIFPGGRPRDIWTLGVDSLPLLIHAARAAEAADLIERHAGWLGPEIRRYRDAVVDPSTGLARDDRAFSTHRDTVRTRSNAYANTMLALLDRDLRETGWFETPFADGLVDRVVAAHWRGDRFVDRPDGSEVTGDATVAPFFFGVVPDSLGLGAALAAARDAGLADPLPLRYAGRRDPAAEGSVQRRLLDDYQGTAIWTSLGAMYLRLLQRVDPGQARPVVAAYRSLVERDGTVVEVYASTPSAAPGGSAPPERTTAVEGATAAGGTASPDRTRLKEDPCAGLRPYRGRLGLFMADEAMLWAAILLEAFVEDRTAGPPVSRRPAAGPSGAGS